MKAKVATTPKGATLIEVSCDDFTVVFTDSKRGLTLYDEPRRTNSRGEGENEPPPELYRKMYAAAVEVARRIKPPAAPAPTPHEEVVS